MLQVFYKSSGIRFHNNYVGCIVGDWQKDAKYTDQVLKVIHRWISLGMYIVHCWCTYQNDKIIYYYFNLSNISKVYHTCGQPVVDYY